eukprot:CAMPEP_0171181262 /NCGR_PEP_ID=MMETSP0790-20130122/14171_1 /TAXON_ID=2925 /ORGANISM="Alexandrium catenella, Strain OF101" /LENGTH=233 /DNA_ID=CAMNT_0011646199 /DNA_START=43 /DNA_END=742 /DNA_ORIENTATION=+
MTTHRGQNRRLHAVDNDSTRHASATLLAPGAAQPPDRQKALSAFTSGGGTSGDLTLSRRLFAGGGGGASGDLVLSRRLFAGGGGGVSSEDLMLNRRLGGVDPCVSTKRPLLKPPMAPVMRSTSSSFCPFADSEQSRHSSLSSGIVRARTTVATKARSWRPSRCDPSAALSFVGCSGPQSRPRSSQAGAGSAMRLASRVAKSAPTIAERLVGRGIASSSQERSGRDGLGGGGPG